MADVRSRRLINSRLHYIVSANLTVVDAELPHDSPLSAECCPAVAAKYAFAATKRAFAAINEPPNCGATLVLQLQSGIVAATASDGRSR